MAQRSQTAAQIRALRLLSRTDFRERPAWLAEFLEDAGMSEKAWHEWPPDRCRELIAKFKNNPHLLKISRWTGYHRRIIRPTPKYIVCKKEAGAWYRALWHGTWAEILTPEEIGQLCGGN